MVSQQLATDVVAAATREYLVYRRPRGRVARLV